MIKSTVHSNDTFLCSLQNFEDSINTARGRRRAKGKEGNSFDIFCFPSSFLYLSSFKHTLHTRSPRSFIRAKIFFFVSRIVRIPLAKVETFHCHNENYDHVSPRDDFETKLPAVKRDYNDSTITHSSHV